MRSRTSAVGLLAVAGVVMGHTLGYTAADPTAGLTSGHPYLDAIGLAVVPLGALALVVLAVRSARATDLGGLDWRRLALAQMLVFSALEVYERFVVGTLDTLVSEPGVALGLLAQIPVAVLLCWLVRAGAGVIARYLDRWSPAADTAVPAWTPVVLAPRSYSVTAPRFRRGPPRSLH